MYNRAWLYPHTAEREYERLLLAYVRQFSMDTEARLKELDMLRLDDWSSDLTAVLLELASRALGVGQSVILRLPEIYAQVNRFNDKQWRLVVKAGTGLDIGPSGAIPTGAVPFGSVSRPGVIRARFGIGVDVYRSEPWLAVRQANWVAQNTALIKNLTGQYFTNVESIVRQGVMSGVAPRVLAKQIHENSRGVSMRRATLIATDQIGKANAELTQYRQMDLGVKDYKWITAHDERVRPEHRARDGKEFSWDKPPSDGHPGMPIRCRCFASPVFPKMD